MNAWLNNTLIELKLNFRDRQTLFWNYVFPLFFLFIFSSIFARGNPKAATALMPGLLSISAMAAGFFGLGIGLVTARERGILRRYQLSPLSPWVLISSQLACNFLIALSTLLLQLTLARLIYRVQVAGSLAALLVMLSVGALAFLALGFIISSVAESAKVALVMANVLFYPFMFLSGAALPRQMLSPELRRFSHVLPPSYLVEGLGRIMVDGQGLGSNAVSLAVLAATVIVALFVAAKLFRWDAREPLPAAKKAWVAAVVLLFAVAALWTRRW
jgi:ABC-2 type transport system permease protein